MQHFCEVLKSTYPDAYINANMQ